MTRSLSGVEVRSLSGVEVRSLSGVEVRSLSGVEVLFFSCYASCKNIFFLTEALN
jgi:hypothetical protein